MKKVTGILVGAASLTCLAANAFAVSIVDYSTLATSVNAELSPAIVAGLPIMGTIMAVGVGLGMIKHMVGKR